MACGRRFGKTALGGILLVNGAAEGYPVGWFAPTYKMLDELWRELLTWVQGHTTKISAADHRIELRGGGSIEMWSLDTPDAARGRKYARVAIDEAAMIPVLEEAWQSVIRPCLTDLRGDMWMLSTPRGQNYFKTCFDYGQNPNHPEWMSWCMPTSANPYIHPDEIEAARKELTQRRFEQEYLAKFLSGEGYVFRNIDEVCVGTVQPYDRNHTYVAGLDFGRVYDNTVVCIFDCNDMREVYLDKFNGLSWPMQRTRIKASLDRYHVTTALAEENSFGSPNIQELAAEGVPMTPFITTNATKRVIVEELVVSLENKSIVLLDDPVAKAELLSFEETVLPSGLVRYAAAEGKHDDTVIARCLAHYAASEGNATFLKMDESFETTMPMRDRW